MQNIAGKVFLIRVDGSHEIGLGHIYRMKTIAKALTEHGGNVLFLTLDDTVSTSILAETGLPFKTFKPDTYLASFKQVLDNYKPKVIIFDILTSPPQIFPFVRENSSALIITFDDVGAGLVYADIVINSIVFHWRKYDRAKCSAKIYEGPLYMPLQSIISKYKGQYKPGRSPVKIFIAFGGTDTHSITPKFINILNNIKLEIEVTVSIGSGYEPDKNFPQSRHPIKMLYAPRNLFAKICKANIVICAGGIMLYELAALGVPSLAIAAEKHEVKNIMFWEKIGTTIFGGEQDALQVSKICQLLKNLIQDTPKRSEMSIASQQTMDTGGTDRILGIIDRAIV